MREFSFESFALKLRALRHSKNYSQTKMAELFNVSRDVYATYESGKTQPSYSFLYNLSMLFEISSDELLTPLDKYTANKIRSLLTKRELEKFGSVLSRFDGGDVAPLVVPVRKIK